MFIVTVLAVCQETSRLLRCDDSAANSIVAGAATGALLLGLQRELTTCAILYCSPAPPPALVSWLICWLLVSGGKNASLPAAIVCGSAAGAWHVLDDRLQPVAFFQQWLVDNDLMDLSGATGCFLVFDIEILMLVKQEYVGHVQL